MQLGFNDGRIKMDQDPFRYDKWIENALRSVVKQALEQVRDEGLWGNHHFYITFQTTFPGVEMPEKLKAQYPEEITIVLQYEFWDMEVNEDEFKVTLSFDNVRSPLVIPYPAITAFADPAVKFGLQLKMDGTGEDDEFFSEDMSFEEAVPVATVEAQETQEETPAPEEKMGEVIALDAFRKK
ncbi:MAG: ClpXP protease specificity-enhancing factor SspB [Rhodospirillales bacterium]|nr:ClpXP protease specificity-enhancing factor SspB [Rhodospirillales bacterium]